MSSGDEERRESMWDRIREEHRVARDHVLEYLSTLDTTLGLIEESRKCAMDSREWLDRFKRMRDEAKEAERHLAEAGQLVLLEAALEAPKDGTQVSGRIKSQEADDMHLRKQRKRKDVSGNDGSRS